MKCNRGYIPKSYLRALREWLLMDTQEVRSKCLSLEQNLLRLRQVLSVIFVQPFKFNISMFLQFWIKVHAYFAPVTPPPSVHGGGQRLCRCCIIL